MAASKLDFGPYETLLERLLDEAQKAKTEFMYWVQHLSYEERLLGICLFVFVLMMLMFNYSRRDRDPGSQKRQFSGAIVLVVLFAFGASWILDSGSGQLSHLFAR